MTRSGASPILRLQRPSRGRHRLGKELEKLGVHVTVQYAVLGPYDFVNIVEAPDNETVARVSAQLAARGTVRITSCPAIPIDVFINGLKG